ncbi:hypothetical protein LEP1GSC172_1456 [Leptospira noguchii]|uniref:Uncharacterized protein n=1 Tax=Leptospira noguchii TaxID=28182 RepID=M6VQP3_9LEPT|nr:hypothetical protein LEP1GSC172_1456 [Leptospira noguchii]
MQILKTFILKNGNYKLSETSLQNEFNTTFLLTTNFHSSDRPTTHRFFSKFHSLYSKRILKSDRF